jgi:hypothetical protein
MPLRNPSATEHERIALEILRDALDKLVFNVAAWPSKYLDKFELAAHEAEYTDNAELKALTKKWRRMAKRSWGVKSGKQWRRSLPSDYDHVEELLEEAMHGKLPPIPVKANFSAPQKKKSESWAAYHDRLTAMARDAKKRGDVAVANTLLVRAGEIARVRKRVRDKPRGRGASGPGTYPWEQCIQDQLGRYGTMDRAKRVCGAIRARSQRTYPAYWKARDPGRALPGPRMNPGKPAVFYTGEGTIGGKLAMYVVAATEGKRLYDVHVFARPDGGKVVDRLERWGPTQGATLDADLDATFAAMVKDTRIEVRSKAYRTGDLSAKKNPESDLTWLVLAEPGGGYFWVVYGYNHYDLREGQAQDGARRPGRSTLGDHQAARPPVRRARAQGTPAGIGPCRRSTQSWSSRPSTGASCGPCTTARVDAISRCTPTTWRARVSRRAAAQATGTWASSSAFAAK